MHVCLIHVIFQIHMSKLQKSHGNPPEASGTVLPPSWNALLSSSQPVGSPSCMAGHAAM